MNDDKSSIKRQDFQDVLTDLDEGRLHEQLTALWPAVVKAVRENNKPGSLTLTLTATNDTGRMVVVASKVTTKLPAPATQPTIFYTDEEGNISRHDPKQQTLKVVNLKKDGN